MRFTYSFGFFNFIKFRFGHDALVTFKLISKLHKTIINNKLRVYFLRRCLANNIVPPHADCLHKFNNNFFSRKLNNKFKHMRDRTSKCLLGLELEDAHTRINNSLLRLSSLSYKIFCLVPVSVCNNFYHTQFSSLRYYYIKEFKRLDKKLSWLLFKRVPTLPNNICYYYNPSSINAPYSTAVLSTSSSNRASIKIDILPPPLPSFPKDPFLINENCFVDLSSVSIPSHVQSLLQ